MMWLEHTVMFPTLHSTIRAVLDSEDNANIVQFVLEPLAFPAVLDNFRSHGNHFAHQLSFLTRTFAFYMHREYSKIVEYEIPHLPPQNEYNICVNTYSVSAARCDAPYYSRPVTTSTQPDQSYTVPTVQLPCTTAPVNTLSTNITLPVHSTRNRATQSQGGAVACRVRLTTTMTRLRSDMLGEEEGDSAGVHVVLAV